MLPLTRKINIDRELKAIVEHCGLFKAGEIVTHDEIQAVTGLAKESPAWKKLVNAWKKWAMETRRQLLIAQPGVGYRFATPIQQLEQAVKWQRQGIRKSRLGGVVAGVIDPDQLGDAAKELQRNIVGFGERSRDLLAAAAAERKALLSRHESLPRLQISE